MIIIKSIAIGKDVRIGFIKSGNIVPQAMTLRSIEIGRPKLYQAMDTVFAAMKKSYGHHQRKSRGQRTEGTVQLHAGQRSVLVHTERGSKNRFDKNEVQDGSH